MLKQMIQQMPLKIELLVSLTILRVMEQQSAKWRVPMLRDLAGETVQKTKIKEQCNLHKLLTEAQQVGSAPIRADEVMIISRDPRSQDTFSTLANLKTQ